MPIQLQPISRRRFLAGSLAAGAALAFHPKSFAASQPNSWNSWALLSDPHLAAERWLVARGANMTDHFIAVSREVLALPELPAGVFINGDCAYNTGQIVDYARLIQLLEPIRKAQIPIHLALGNHDHREHFWQALQEEKAAKRPLADKQAVLIPTPMLNWFILDSLEQTLSTPGLLGPEQLTWLASSLDANPEKPAVILVHHNPSTIGMASGLKDTEAFFQVIRPRKQVKAYVFGHTHVWKIERDPSGIHLINLPAVSYPFQVEQPVGWVHATLQPRGARFELRCLDPKHKSHGEIVNLAWRA